VHRVWYHRHVDDVATVLQELALRYPELRLVRLVRYRPRPGASDRAAGAECDGLRESLQHAGGLAGRHTQRSRATRHEVNAADLREGRLRAIVQSLKTDGDTAIGACSLVVLESGREAYVPMMDFDCTPTQENEDTIARAFSLLGYNGGAIVRADTSFHFYGLDLLDEGSWIDFVASCLLLPLSDVRYIGHCLLERTNYLRITEGGHKKEVPTVARWLGPRQNVKSS
jgi:hypothetical protein